MKTARTLGRLAVARRLAQLALNVAAGRAIRIGKSSVVVPERLVLEESLELEDGETELEFELKWSTGRLPAKKKPRGRR